MDLSAVQIWEAAVSRIGYGRVSTIDQHPESQHDALVEAGCNQIYIDNGVSGMKASRPELDKCLAYLRPGDVLVVTKLDRLGRSVKNLIELVNLLGEKGVDLQVLQQGIDTTTPAGTFLFHVLASVAEFERDLIAERTMEGLKAARARGRVGGRKISYTPLQAKTARAMMATREHTADEIARTLNVSRSTVYRMLRTEAASGREALPLARRPSHSL